MRFAGKQSITLISFFLLIFSLSVQSEEVLYTAEYEGKHSGMTVKTTRSLQRTGENSYVFYSLAKSMFASIEEISSFKFENSSVIPQSYRYKRNIFGAKKEEEIKFDWNDHTATYRQEGRPEKHTVHKAYPGLLDPSLYQFQLQLDLLHGEEDLNYDFVRHQRVKNYQFKVVGEETLNIGGKDHQTIKVERVNDESKKTTIWLVPALQYQMAKIRHIDEDGDEYEMHMTSYRSHPEQFGELLDLDNRSSANLSAEDLPARSIK